MSSSDLFDAVDTLPDADFERRYDRLVGLDEVKARLVKEAQILLDPPALERWSQEHHQRVISAVEAFRERIPLFVFAGDVGTGKTELAETFGDRVARDSKLEVSLMSLSLSARGSGAVGEMTNLISAAFDEVENEIPIPEPGQAPEYAGVLLIDEADALAQSREMAQMHHEDRAGVNALIRRIGRVAAGRRPVLTVLCTNRADAIDPAILRRAAAVFTFERPNAEQREQIFKERLDDAGLGDDTIEALVKGTGARDGLDYGHTFSDLTTRLIPAIVLDAYPDSPLTPERALAVMNATPPTAPFTAQGG